MMESFSPIDLTIPDAVMIEPFKTKSFNMNGWVWWLIAIVIVASIIYSISFRSQNRYQQNKAE